MQVNLRRLARIFALHHLYRLRSSGRFCRIPTIVIPDHRTSLLLENSMKTWIRCAATLALAAASSLAPSASAQDKVTFEDHVKPILRDRCLTCQHQQEILRP